MFQNSSARMSVDSLSPTSPNAHRGDFPFHRQGSAPAYPGQRRGSTASSIHSIGGALDSSSGSWGGAVLETGQNAISTLLQPPIVRTGLVPHASAPASSAHKPPTAKDIPPVALTNVPHVDPTDFKPYLSQVGALYDQLRRIKESEEDAADILHRRSSRQDELVEGYDDHHLRPGKRPSASRKSSVSSLSSVSALEAPSPIRRSSSGYIRRSTHGPPPLSTIPNVYFEEDFHLENPRTFDVVSERSEVVRPPPGALDDKKRPNGGASAPRKALATNAILQEKLSWYMDTVEMHLISSISTASTTFFTALGSLKDLHSEAAESVERIKALRKELIALDEEIATSGLDIIQRRRRRENLQQLHDAVLQLREIVDGVAHCESLANSGEAEKALDGIDGLEKLIAGEQGPSSSPAATARVLQDLRGAAALQGVNSDIATLRFRIGREYESKFASVLIGDLRRHVDTVKPREVLMRWSSASLRARGGHAREPSVFPSYMASTEDLRAELLESLAGLHRAKHITVAATSYREAAMKEIRSHVRRPLPSSNDDDNESMMSSSTMTGGRQRSQQERSTTLARNLRALEPEDAEDLLVKIYIGITETMRRLTTQVKLLLDVASTLGEDAEPSGMRSPLASPTGRRPSIASLEAQEEIHKAIDLPGLLGQAADVAQDKIVKILRVRSEQSTHLPLVWFLRYFTLNLHFANECESISGRSGTSLKTVVNGHIKDFVQQHGDKEKQTLAQGMDSDQWNARDFTEKDTALLSEILDCSTKDPADWLEGTKIWSPYSETDPEAGGAAGTTHNPNGGAAKTKTRSAVIDSETFVLPYSAVLCMSGMSHFLHLIAGIPSMAPHIAPSLVAFLQLFNSRCTQLILGAGATRSAGLKNITTKHLALASQALAFIATLIPHVREFVRRHAGSGPAVSSLMGEYDRVRRLYQEHQNSIYDKLVEIMSSRASAHARVMKAIDWDGAGQKDAVHGYMETMAKETTTLHRNLTKHLPEGTVRVIMAPVFASYKEQLGKVFVAAEPKTELGRSSMLRDVAFLEAKLGKIDGFGDTGEYLTKIIKAKQVKTPTTPPPPPPAPVPAPAPAPAAEALPATNGEGKAAANKSPDAGAGAKEPSGGQEGAAQAATKGAEEEPAEKAPSPKAEEKK